MRRRHWFWISLATAVLIGGFVVMATAVYPWFRWTEDFFPGSAPTDVLEPQAWEDDDVFRFAVLGDGGTGGRNAMDVASAMVDAYETRPYGVVIHVGDVAYYGSIADRWEQVFVEPYGPLLDAGVAFEIAVGNHELEEMPTERAEAELVALLERTAAEGRYYVVRHGPVDFFVLDSSTPQITGNARGEQIGWLESALAESDAPWKVAVLHHPPYASGPKRGSNLPVREAVEPLFVEHGVQLVLTGHDHFYERSHPQQGIVYVVSGAGAKLSPTGESDFTAAAARELQFMIIEVDGVTMSAEAIGADGQVIDAFVVERGAS